MNIDRVKQVSLCQYIRNNQSRNRPSLPASEGRRPRSNKAAGWAKVLILVELALVVAFLDSDIPLAIPGRKFRGADGDEDRAFYLGAAQRRRGGEVIPSLDISEYEDADQDVSFAYDA